MRLVDVFADCALLAERVIEHPLLLDDLLGGQSDSELPGRGGLDAEIGRRLALVDAGDAESAIEILQEEKQSATFRIGLAYRSGLAATVAARALSETAEAIVARALALAERDLARAHGKLPGGIAVIGYGSLGGAELGFASDLDLVFVYDGNLTQAESDGARPLEGARYFARIAQRVVHWLTTQTRAGKLYDVDVRLRPDGGKGLLVVSLRGVRRLPARTRMDLGIAGARARASDRGRCAGLHEVLDATRGLRCSTARPRRRTRRGRRDARALARRARPLRSIRCST